MHQGSGKVKRNHLLFRFSFWYMLLIERKKLLVASKFTLVSDASFDVFQHSSSQWGRTAEPKQHELFLEGKTVLWMECKGKLRIAGFRG